MASGVMQIKYGEERIASKASKACNELDDICSSLSKVRKKLNGLPERSRSGDNLSSASAFLKKKQKQYEDRQNALEVLKTRTNNFMSKVETTEKKLSSQIKKEYKQFHKQTGIGKTRGAVILEGIGKAGKFVLKMATYLIPGYGTVKLVKDLWTAGTKIVDAIKTWYNNLPEGIKFAFKAIGAVVAAVVAVIGVVTAIGAIAAAATAAAIAFAVVAAAGAIIVGADKILGAAQAVGAAIAYFSGEKGMARELDSMSTAEFWGPALGISPDVYNGIQTFGSVCSFIGSIGSFAVKVHEGVPKMVNQFGTFKDNLAAYGKSFKVQMLEKVKGLTGLKNFKNFKSYVQKNGFKAIFTQTLKLTDKDHMGALKGLKTIYDWANFKQIKNVIKIVNADGILGKTWEVVDVLF